MRAYLSFPLPFLLGYQHFRNAVGINDQADLGPSLERRLLSQGKSYLALLVSVCCCFFFFYYIGLKNSYLDTSPSVCASCWLSCFSFTVALCLSCETDICVSCSAQQDLQQQDWLIQDWGGSQARGTQRSTECFPVLITVIGNSILKNDSNEFSKRVLTYQDFIRLCMDSGLKGTTYVLY